MITRVGYDETDERYQVYRGSYASGSWVLLREYCTEREAKAFALGYDQVSARFAQ